MKRIVSVLFLVLAAVLASGCGSSTSPASVNGESIDGGEFLDQLGQLSKLNGGNDKSVTTDMSTDLLTQRIVAALISDEIERLGIEISEAEIESIRAELETSLADRAEAGEATDVISKSFIAYAARVEAEQSALIARITDTADPWFGDAEVSSYYDFVKESKYTNYCVHHILVDAEADANTIVSQLDNGADFSQIAKDRSTDTASATNGGDLGCQAKGAFVPEFEDAALKTAAGDTVGPVKSTFGFHIIRVDREYGLQPLDDGLREEIAATLATQDGWLLWKIHSSKIDVNKKYGSWSNDSTSVVPPADPTVK